MLLHTFSVIRIFFIRITKAHFSIIFSQKWWCAQLLTRLACPNERVRWEKCFKHIIGGRDRSEISKFDTKFKNNPILIKEKCVPAMHQVVFGDSCGLSPTPRPSLQPSCQLHSSTPHVRETVWSVSPGKWKSNNKLLTLPPFDLNSQTEPW